LGGAPSHAVGTLENRKNKVLELLQLNALPVGAHERLWSELDTPYLLQNDPEEIAWHTRHLYQRVDTPIPVVKARIAPSGEGIQVMIYIPDQKDLFAHICGFFERINYSIVEAKIHTTRHGYALDSFLVMDPSNAAEHYRDVISFVEYELEQGLRQRLEKETPLEPPLQGRLSRHLKHFPITPTVYIEPDEKGSYHVLSIVAGDQPGLLSRIAQILARFGVTVHSAKISTLGGRAEDTFLISGKILNEARTLIRMETDLLQALQT